VAGTDRTLRDFDAEADRLLVRDVASGSTESLARLYDRHAATVYGLVRRIVQVSEDAEELVQDVFAQVWLDARRYEASRATVAALIVMLARARAIERLRARRARPDLGPGSETTPVVPSTPPEPEPVTIALGEVDRVREALGTLPDAEHELLQLAYFEGLTYTGIADRTGVPLGTVKTRLRSALATLREAVTSGPTTGGTIHR